MKYKRTDETGVRSNSLSIPLCYKDVSDGHSVERPPTLTKNEIGRETVVPKCASERVDYHVRETLALAERPCHDAQAEPTVKKGGSMYSGESDFESLQLSTVSIPPSELPFKQSFKSASESTSTSNPPPTNHDPFIMAEPAPKIVHGLPLLQIQPPSYQMPSKIPGLTNTLRTNFLPLLIDNPTPIKKGLESAVVNRQVGNSMRAKEEPTITNAKETTKKEKKVSRKEKRRSKDRSRSRERKSERRSDKKEEIRRTKDDHKKSGDHKKLYDCKKDPLRDRSKENVSESKNVKSVDVAPRYFARVEPSTAENDLKSAVISTHPQRPLPLLEFTQNVTHSVNNDAASNPKSFIDPLLIRDFTLNRDQRRQRVDENSTFTAVHPIRPAFICFQPRTEEFSDKERADGANVCPPVDLASNIVEPSEGTRAESLKCSEPTKEDESKTAVKKVSAAYTQTRPTEDESTTICAGTKYDALSAASIQFRISAAMGHLNQIVKEHEIEEERKADQTATTTKTPMGEKDPPSLPHGTVDRGLQTDEESVGHPNPPIDIGTDTNDLNFAEEMRTEDNLRSFPIENVEPEKQFVSVLDRGPSISLATDGNATNDFILVIERESKDKGKGVRKEVVREVGNISSYPGFDVGTNRNRTSTALADKNLSSYESTTNGKIDARMKNLHDRLQFRLCQMAEDLKRDRRAATRAEIDLIVSENIHSDLPSEPTRRPILHEEKRRDTNSSNFSEKQRQKVLLAQGIDETSPPVSMTTALGIVDLIRKSAEKIAHPDVEPIVPAVISDPSVGASNDEVDRESVENDELYRRLSGVEVDADITKPSPRTTQTDLINGTLCLSEDYLNDCESVRSDGNDLEDSMKKEGSGRNGMKNPASDGLLPLPIIEPNDAPTDAKASPPARAADVDLSANGQNRASDTVFSRRVDAAFQLLDEMMVDEQQSKRLQLQQHLLLKKQPLQRPRQPSPTPKPNSRPRSRPSSMPSPSSPTPTVRSRKRLEEVVHLQNPVTARKPMHESVTYTQQLQRIASSVSPTVVLRPLPRTQSAPGKSSSDSRTERQHGGKANKRLGPSRNRPLARGDPGLSATQVDNIFANFLSDNPANEGSFNARARCILHGGGGAIGGGVGAGVVGGEGVVGEAAAEAAGIATVDITTPQGDNRELAPFDGVLDSIDFKKGSSVDGPSEGGSECINWDEIDAILENP